MIGQLINAFLAAGEMVAQGALLLFIGFVTWLIIFGYLGVLVKLIKSEHAVAKIVASLMLVAAFVFTGKVVQTWLLSLVR